MNKPDIVTRLREWYWYPSKTAHEAAAEIVRLRAERDEARREVCECKCSPPKTPFFGAPQELAEVNGWDCFKEDGK
jgi:hypothetical protein